MTRVTMSMARVDGRWVGRLRADVVSTQAEHDSLEKLTAALLAALIRADASVTSNWSKRLSESSRTRLLQWQCALERTVDAALPGSDA